jgi:lysozyme
MANLITGIDVSKYQYDIDWTTIQQPITHLDPMPVQFAFIKATEGVGYIDPYAQANATGAKAAGLKIGYYHFGTLNNIANPVADAQSEAQAFLAAMAKLPAHDLPPVLDIEKNASNLSKQQVLDWINAFFAEMQKGGVTKYIIYSYKYFFDANLPANHGLGTIPLWLASYSKVTTPALPIGWNNYIIWQYRSDGQFKGKDGKAVPCDINKGNDGFWL